MKRSDGRILTTHAGSLPRPTQLTEAHAARARGEPTDQAAFDQLARLATREVVARQIGLGLDIVNNGEVGRESFFTYLRHRMSGFGGQSQRRSQGDLLRYPTYVEVLQRFRGPGEKVSVFSAPQAIAEVRYTSSDPIARECAELAALLGEHSGAYSEAFMSSPSPGIVAAAMQNAYYADLDAYVAALADALRVEYHAIVDAGFVLQIDAPDLALERHTLFQDKPLSEFLDFARVEAKKLVLGSGAIAAETVRRT